jgi:hypothetical protein
MAREQSITKLSLAHEILSPYTAFIAVQTESSANSNVESIVDHVLIQTVYDHDRTPHDSKTPRYEANACAFQANLIEGCQE